MRLSSFPESVIPAFIVASLAELGIRTDVEFVFSSPLHEILKRLRPGTTTLRQLQAYVEAISELSSATGSTSVELLEKSEERLNDISSGIPALDDLLHGFGGSRVIQLSGDRNSGKTTLALHIVIRHLCSHPNVNILWIDTTGESAPDRISSIWSTYNDLPVADTALDRLQVCQVPDIDTAQDVLQDIVSSDLQLSCIVIDTITQLISPLLSAISSQGHAIMCGFMRQLRALGDTHGTTTIVLNNATSCKPNNPNSAFWLEKKPSLGPTFGTLCDAILWLSECEVSDLDGATTYTAEVLASKSTRKRAWCAWKISGNSISHVVLK